MHFFEIGNHESVITAQFQLADEFIPEPFDDPYNLAHGTPVFPVTHDPDFYKIIVQRPGKIFRPDINVFFRIFRNHKGKFYIDEINSSSYQVSAAFSLVFAEFADRNRALGGQRFQDIFQVGFQMLLAYMQFFNELLETVGPLTVLFQELNYISLELIKFFIGFGYIFFISFLCHSFIVVKSR